MKLNNHLIYILLVVCYFISCTPILDFEEEEECNNPHECYHLVWKVNGEQFEAECEGDPLFGCNPVDCQYYDDTKSLSIYGGSLSKHGLKLYIYRHLNTNGTLVQLQEHDEFTYGNGNKDRSCRSYSLDSTQGYFIKIIHLDTNLKNIRGKFGFTAVNECGDTARITDGYFNLTYRP